MSVEDQKSAGLAMFGVGAWFAKEDEKDKNFGRYRERLDTIGNLVGKPKSFLSADMGDDGIGNQIFFAPPAGPVYANLSDEGKMHDHAYKREKVKELQGTVREASIANTIGMWPVWAIPRMVENDPASFVDPKETGFHVIDSVAEAKANILLNMRCNAKLDRIKGYPFTRTCCTDYGNKPFVQRALVFLGMIYLAACLVGETLDLVARRSAPAWRLVNMETGSFVMALLMCYYADRTQLLAKGSKVYQYSDFIILCAPCIALALVTFRRSVAAQPAKANEPLVVDARDQPFLSRDQTEEWKGWMQFVILVYHWTAAARSTGIYILVRLLVAAYLFQTGYGHTTYFLLKKDFSFKRVASVMLRLNLLSCSLAYFMNTDYMFYYFSPLCSFWFMVVYLTLAIGSKYNGDTQLVLSKICVSAVLVSLVVLATPLTKWTFGLLRLFFNIQWDLQEWEYRVALDIFIVYVGMLSAVAYIKLKEELRLPLRLALAMAGLAVMVGYSYACGTKMASMADYKLWHPYVSFVPILAFIAVRNVSGPVRNFHSRAMAWLGRCSLETYTLQFHLFLAADTQSVLLLDWFRGGDGTLLGDRWRSLVIVVPVFLWISHVTAQATNSLVKAILTTSPEPESQTPSVESSRDAEKESYYRDDDGGSSDSGSILESSVNLLGRSRSRVSRAVSRLPSARAVAYSLPTRILIILAVMWALNLASPVYNAPAPDGFTPRRVEPGAAQVAPPQASGSAVPVAQAPPPPQVSAK